MSTKMELLSLLKTQAKMDTDIPPVVPIETYFEENFDESSIAPAQIGRGRPPIIFMYSQLLLMQQQRETQLILVGLHPDWVIAEDYPEEWPPAEYIHVYSKAPIENVASWAQDLGVDEIIEGWPYDDAPAFAPDIYQGYTIYTFYWHPY